MGGVAVKRQSRPQTRQRGGQPGCDSQRIEWGVPKTCEVNCRLDGGGDRILYVPPLTPDRYIETPKQVPPVETRTELVAGQVQETSE